MIQPSIYRMRLREILTVCVLGLLCLGAVMVQSASMNVTGQVQWHLSERGAKHWMYAGMALATFLLLARLDLAAFLGRPRPLHRSPATWLLLVAAAACLLVLIPGVAKPVNGAYRWLSLGFVQVQPSELGKWAVVLFLAWFLATQPLNTEKLYGVLVALIPVGGICLLVIIEDFGTAALIGACAIAMCLAGRVKLRHLALMVPPMVGGAIWFIAREPYRVRRMLSFLDPWASPEREGYHMVQSLMSFATGGLFGKGLGRGVQKLGYLPEDTTDFIFAVICEELGLFGAMLVICLYCGILFVAWQAIRQRKADDAFAPLLAFGVGAMIGLQALINIAVATVSVPPKGMSLPLVSAGGSGLVITCAALGLLAGACGRREEAGLAEEEMALPQDDMPLAGVVRGG